MGVPGSHPARTPSHAAPRAIDSLADVVVHEDGVVRHVAGFGEGRKAVFDQGDLAVLVSEVAAQSCWPVRQP